MKVMESQGANETNGFIAQNISEESIVFSDKSTSYFDIADYVEVYVTEKSTKKSTKTTLQWVHITISNAKWTLLGTYHKIKGKYL